MLFSNAAELPVIEGCDVGAVLQSISVEFCQREFKRFAPPRLYSNVFRNAFYKFEVIDALAEQDAPYLMLLDSDCVMAHRCDEVFRLLSQQGLAVTTVMAANASVAHQGIDPAEFARVYEQIIGECVPVTWYGGEFYCGVPDTFKQLSSSIAKMLRQIELSVTLCEHQFSNSRSIFSNDEFIASLAITDSNISVVSCDQFVRRLWTGADSHRNLSDRRYPIWHLPAEKHLGFNRLFDNVCAENSWFWTCSDEEFVDQLGGIMAIPIRDWNPKLSQSQSVFVRVARDLVRKLLPRKIWLGLRGLYFRGRWGSE